MYSGEIASVPRESNIRRSGRRRIWAPPHYKLHPRLKESGHFVMGEALELRGSAMTVQMRDGPETAARAFYRRALELTHQSAERRFLQARLLELAGERAHIKD